MPLPNSFLPLKPVDFLLLVVLVDQERHGYGITREIADRTDGVIELEPGNLYRVIKRLLDDGLVAESTRRQVDGLDDERRRYYRLTALGERVVALEVQRLRAMFATPALRALARRMRTA